MFSSQHEHRGQDIHITGLGVVTAVGQGRTQFCDALFAGKHAFRVMGRAGRGIPVRTAGTDEYTETPAFLGAELGELTLPATLSKKNLRTASLSAQAALITLDEAWQDAKLDTLDPHRIGLIVGGSNIQQRELVLTQAAFAQKIPFVRPTYGFSFLDSDVCGLCSEHFGIKGFTYTLGGASASGQLAIIQAADAVLAGKVDVCIAMGALMDVSYWECQAFRALGAMGSARYFDSPDRACRPFDKDRDGFIYGEACGVVVVERAASAARRNVDPYARIASYAVAADGNRNPNPALEGERRVISATLNSANLSGKDIDYVNTHGAASIVGDEIELEAIRACGIARARINATKSIVGHGLTAAGAVEVVATVMQMKRSRLHPTRNLEDPIASDIDWVRGTAENHSMQKALCLSMGFGGISSALCIQRC
jgi:malonyl-ACP decarboxylase